MNWTFITKRKTSNCIWGAKTIFIVAEIYQRGMGHKYLQYFINSLSNESLDLNKLFFSWRTDTFLHRLKQNGNTLSVTFSLLRTALLSSQVIVHEIHPWVSSGSTHASNHYSSASSGFFHAAVSTWDKRYVQLMNWRCTLLACRGCRRYPFNSWTR